jgi:hypothetical protein
LWTFLTIVKMKANDNYKDTSLFQSTGPDVMKKIQGPYSQHFIFFVTYEVAQ